MCLFKMVIFSGHVFEQACSVLFLNRMFLIRFASVSSHLMNATDVNPLFYSALLLNALPVPLLRQVYFLMFLRIVFRVCFLFV